jgi:hypothetical protein
VHFFKQKFYTKKHTELNHDSEHGSSFLYCSLLVISWLSEEELVRVRFLYLLN